jgi:hypothetical protein
MGEGKQKGIHTRLRSTGSQYSSLTCQDFSHFFRITMVWRQLGIPRRYGIHTLVYYQQCESMESAITNRPPRPSFPRKRESSISRLFWIPACAGMTGILTASS